MNNPRGNLYYHLKTHKGVDDFMFELSQAHKFPNTYEGDLAYTGGVLSSMWEQLEIKKRPLTHSQVKFARKLIFKMYEGLNK